MKHGNWSAVLRRGATGCVCVLWGGQEDVEGGDTHFATVACLPLYLPQCITSKHALSW